MIFCLNLACDQGQNLDGSRFCQRCGQSLFTPIHQQFELHTQLAVEPYSQVFCATRAEDKKEQKPLKNYLIRQINLQGTNEEYSTRAETYFETEIAKILQLPPHPGIVPLVDCIKNGQDFFLVRPYIQGPTLQQAPGTADYTDTMVREVLVDLLQSLAFLHRHGCVHGGLTQHHLFRKGTSNQFLIVGLGETLATEVAANYPQFDRWDDPTMNGVIQYRQPSHDLYRLSYICAQLLPTQVLSDQQLHHMIAKMMNLSVGDRYHHAGEILQDLERMGPPSTETDSHPTDSKTQYRTVYLQSIQAQFPLSAQVQHELMALQKHLQLTQAEISAIESQAEREELARLKQQINLE